MGQGTGTRLPEAKPFFENLHYSKSLLNVSIKRIRDDDVEKPVDKRNKLDGDEIIMKELNITNTMMKNLREQDTSFLKNTAATHTTQILKNRDF